MEPRDKTSTEILRGQRRICGFVNANSGTWEFGKGGGDLYLSLALLTAGRAGVKRAWTSKINGQMCCFQPDSAGLIRLRVQVGGSAREVKVGSQA